MSVASVLTAAGQIIELVASFLPKRRPKPPKYAPIKPVPPRPVKTAMDPHEEKRR